MLNMLCKYISLQYKKLLNSFAVNLLQERLQIILSFYVQILKYSL